MATYGKILLFAMPVFLTLVLLEKWYGWYKGRDTVKQMDMISSLSSGITNVTKDVLGLSLVIISYEWLADKIAIIHIRPGIWVYIVAFIALDLPAIGCTEFHIITIFSGTIILYTTAAKNLTLPAH